ncbi:glycoside hydrolase family 65 protein [Streptomyces sp. NPDC015130]|uniref:glycoside hydrolase family 65 protein n=1 Tax=Streptomyces sp. NPDC015130 TaxID=3364940 RepID=UPI003701B710
MSPRWSGACGASADDHRHRLTSGVAGERVENEDLVNLPNWTLLRYRRLPDDGPPGDWLTPDSGELRHHGVRLDLRAGVLTRHLLFEDARGRGLRVTHIRLVHMGDPGLAAQCTVFRAYGWSGSIEARSLLDGAVTNAGVERYRHLDGRHLTDHQAGFEPGGVAWLACRTVDPGVGIALAVRTVTRPARPAREEATRTGTVQTYRLPVVPRRSAMVVKTLALHTSTDRPAADPLPAATGGIARAPEFSRLLATHRAAWQRVWEQGELHAPGEAGRILRLHVFHLLQTLSPHTAELDVGVPARGGRWLADHSRLQRHVGSAVAFNVWRYAQATCDRGFLHSAGAEILLEVARYWSGAAVFDPALGRYRIRGVVGPDEYHDAYPDAPAPGIDDNAYTNATAAWVLARGLDLLAELPEARRSELAEQLPLDAAEIARWEDVSRRLYVPFHRGVVSQFDGFGELAELDWDRCRARYGDIRRLDRILEAEGDSVNRYQASKQADTLMLGYLFRPDELRALFARLGYALDDEVWRATVAYYLRRTSHGSTLSSLVHGWVLARQKGADAWRYCEEALLADVADVQGGTTGEGIHLGAMAGTIDLVERGITGLETGPEGLRVAPVPLAEIPRFAFTLCCGRHRGVRLRILPGRLAVRVPASPEGPLTVVLPGDRRVAVAPGQERWFRL